MGINENMRIKVNYDETITSHSFSYNRLVSCAMLIIYKERDNK